MNYRGYFLTRPDAMWAVIGRAEDITGSEKACRDFFVSRCLGTCHYGQTLDNGGPCLVLWRGNHPVKRLSFRASGRVRSENLYL